MSNEVRLRALRESMAKDGVPAMLVTHLPDVRWLCRFTGSNAALAVTRKNAVLFTDGRRGYPAIGIREGTLAATRDAGRQGTDSALCAAPGNFFFRCG